VQANTCAEPAEIEQASNFIYRAAATVEAPGNHASHGQDLGNRVGVQWNAKKMQG
jgi:hypothetical protein